MEEKRNISITIKKEWKMIILVVFGIGLFTHGYMFLNNFLSSDAMWNLYADQNIITSGRWFLSIACGLSSYYQLPWVIGCLSLVWISISAIALIDLFSVKRKSIMIAIAGILVTFPALVSTFSYLYTADGYMLAVALVCISVCLLQKYKWGFLPAGILLGFAIGIYQAYLAFAVLLCMALLFLAILDGEKTKVLWTRVGKMISYGGIGLLFYWSMLQILLRIQNLTLTTYQGIDGMGTFSLSEIPSLLQEAYVDFFTFAVRSKIMANNGVVAVAILLLYAMMILIIINQIINVKLYKKPARIVASFLLLALVPLATNIILLISDEAFNHLVMRFHWVLFLIIPLIFVEKYPIKNQKLKEYFASFVILVVGILIFNNALRANIAYFNMNERYEKTYAYCLRLADRMEQTEGYYVGIPVMIIGVVDAKEYPDTDVTNEITDSMIGVNGSIFLYTGEQYQAFFSHYLSIPLNLIDSDEIIRIYDTDAYRELETFPSMKSMKVVDGILYIKTEPKEEE